MKPIALGLICAAFLLGCTSSSGPDPVEVDGTYTLVKIDGRSIDGLPVNVVSGTLTVNAGTYEEERTVSVWGPDDRGTVRDRGTVNGTGPSLTFVSEVHFFTAGNGDGIALPRQTPGVLDGRNLTVITPNGGWVYHWRRDE